MHSTAPIWPDGDWQDPSMTALTRGLLHLQDIDKFVPKKFQHYIGGGLQCALLPSLCDHPAPLQESRIWHCSGA